ncbi:MFS transporter [Microtetraspora fusca]|uniref:MFS transporter n=1 Tax=Microtetraspora fusca TaxID=1997 RepID=A0ABW6V8S0_MICFU
MALSDLTASDPAARPTGRRLILPLAAVMLAQLLAVVDLNITAAALPAVVAEFGDLDLFAWVTTGAVLASTVTTPLYGRFGDVFGRKPVFVTALAVLSAGSVLCGLSGSMIELVVFRAVQGVGAGGLMVSAVAVYAELLDPRRRVRHQIYFATGMNVFTALSPFVGGLVTDAMGWRWTFFLTVPVALVALVLIATARLARPEGAAAVDYAGAALLGGGCLCLVLLSSWAGTEYAWGSPVVVGLAAAVVLLAALWVRAEHRAARPIVPLRLFRDRVLVAANVQGFVTGLAMFAAITFLPLLMVASGASVTGAGAALLPITAGTLVASLGGSPLMARLGHPQAFGVAGGVLLLAGLVGLAAQTAYGGVAPGPIAVWTACFGVGLGLMFQVYSVAVMNHAPRPDLGAALAVQSLSRQLGGMLGLAALSGVFRSELARTGEHAAAAGVVFAIAAACAAGGLVAALLLRVPHVPSRPPVPAGGRQAS